MARFTLNRGTKKGPRGGGSVSERSIVAGKKGGGSVASGRGEGDDISSYCADARDDNATCATRESTGQSSMAPQAATPKSPKSPKKLTKVKSLKSAKSPTKASKKDVQSEREGPESPVKAVETAAESKAVRKSKAATPKKTNKKKNFNADESSTDSPTEAVERPSARNDKKKRGSPTKGSKRTSRVPVLDVDTSISETDQSVEVTDTSYETDGVSGSVTSYEGSETSGDHESFTEGETFTYDSYDSRKEESRKKFDANESKKLMKKAAMERNAVVDPTHQAAITISEHGSVEKLQIQELGYIPKIDDAEDIVIKIEVSTISLQDCMIRRGKWYDMKPLPYIPGTDIVGTIHEVGEKGLGYGYREGDRVAAVVKGGGNAKYITLKYLEVVKVPKDYDPVAALCLSSTYVPAKEALDLGRKKSTPLTDANILIIGGNGPSGLAAIDLAKLEGANIFATADERHHTYLKELGATCFPIDPMSWLHKLKGKMDIVIDSVCLDEYQSSCLALNTEGTLICTGMSAVYTQGKIRNFIMDDARDIKAVAVKLKAKYILNNSIYYDRTERFECHTREYEQQFKYLCHLNTKGMIKPVVSGSSSLNMVAFTHKAIEHGETPYGVSVCTPWITKSELS